MKKVISVLLSVIMILLCVCPAANAQTADDKISPEVRALIDSNTGGGVVVEIYHHNPNYPTDGISEEVASIVGNNPKHQLTEAEKIAIENNMKAQAELIEQIGEITYMEPDGFTVGRFYIGLPYESIEKVAKLDNIDYIDLPHDEGSLRDTQEKYDDVTREALKSYSSNAEVRLVLRLAYTAHPYIGVPAPGAGASQEKINAYIDAYAEACKAYYNKKNEEYAAVISANADVRAVSISSDNYYIRVETKLSELDQIASLKEVDHIGFQSFINDPHDTPQVYAEKFEQWIYDKKGIVKFDPAMPKTDPDYWKFNYSDYDELYAGDDWGLVFAKVNANETWEVIGHVCIGTRVVSWWEPGAAIYPYGYFVYSAAEDTFYPIDRFVEPVSGYGTDENGEYVKVILEPTISLDDYPGFLEVLDELDIGVLRGDADRDGKVTVLDATHTQRHIADLITMTGLNIAAADADGDGNVTVMDATRIQRTIADLCTIDGTVKE